LWLAHTRCGIPADDLREVALNGFRYAFLPHREKEAMMENVIPAILR
jgi:adenosine deaminase